MMKKKQYFVIKMKLKIVFNGYCLMNMQWKYFCIHGNTKWEIYILNPRDLIGLNKILIFQLFLIYKCDFSNK